MPGYEGISARVRGYKCQGTRVLVPGYEGISARVRGYKCRGTRVLAPGYVIERYSRYQRIRYEQRN